MASDYDDVSKLLGHIHAEGFAYRDFRHPRRSAPGSGIAAVQQAPQSVVPQAVVPQAAEPLPVEPKTPAVERRAVESPLGIAPKNASPVVVPMTLPAAVPVTAIVPAPAPQRTDSLDVASTFDRLSRGVMAAPRLQLSHLHLPPLRAPLAEQDVPETPDAAVSDVLMRLQRQR